MKAAVLHEVNTPLVIEDVSLPNPGPREVLIRTAVAGLCHSDLHFMEGLYPHPLPAVLGHESAGVVEKVGSDVTYVKPGDHVVTCLSVFCGTCDNCTTGRPVLCTDTTVKMLPGASNRLSWARSEKLNQFLNLSSFAEQMLVHENAIVKIRKEMPLDLAALIGCGVITGYGAVVNTAKVTRRRDRGGDRLRRRRHGGDQRRGDRRRRPHHRDRHQSRKAAARDQARRHRHRRSPEWRRGAAGARTHQRRRASFLRGARPQGDRRAGVRACWRPAAPRPSSA